MNLQIALFAIGILLIVLIYAVSKWLDKKQNHKASSGSGKNRLSDRDEPKLIDSGDEDASGRWSPVLDMADSEDEYNESADSNENTDYDADNLVESENCNKDGLISKTLELEKHSDQDQSHDLGAIDELMDEVTTLEDRVERLADKNGIDQEMLDLSTEQDSQPEEDNRNSDSSSDEISHTESDTQRGANIDDNELLHGDAMEDDKRKDRDESSLDANRKELDTQDYDIDSDETIPELNEPVYTKVIPDDTNPDQMNNLEAEKRASQGNKAVNKTGDKSGLTKDHERRVEPKLGEISEPQPEVLNADQEKISGQYQYPEIEGFEKISQIDYWVKISGNRDVGRESVLAQYREMVSSIAKPCTIYGLKLPEKSWCDLENQSEDSRFGDLVITVQLADQRGSIKEKDLNQFTRLISNLSEGTGRGFTFMAPIESALKQAQAIADFVRYYESIFIVNIKPEKKEPFEGSTISRCATQLGLEESDKNYFVRNKSVGKDKVCLYSLANMTETGEFDFKNIKNTQLDGVIFFTKPAVNRSPGAVFSEMVDTAKAFAARTKGRVVAPKTDDLSQEDVDRIRQSIEKVAHEMEQMGLAPGSDEAMRIF